VNNYFRAFRGFTENNLCVILNLQGKEKTMNTSISEKLKEINRDVGLALSEIGKKHGVSFNVGTVSYNDLYFSFSTKGRFLNAAGSTEDADKAEWDSYCGKFGLTSDMFGRMTMVAGKAYRIVRIAPKARKFPVIGQMGSGGKFKLTAESVRMGMIATKNITTTASEVEKTA
jgi:hypothetical protein